MSGTADKSLLNATFVNGGKVRVTGGRLACVFSGYGQRVEVSNEIGGLFELDGSAEVAEVNPSGWPPVLLAFVNEGVVRKAGQGEGRLTRMPLINHGTVEVLAGSLLWTGGGSSGGLFKVAAEAAVSLHTGTFNLGGSRWEGAGPVRLAGDATLNGSFVAENFGFAAGMLRGDFDVAGSFTWTGGTLVTARARLGAGRHAIVGDALKELLDARLANAGELLVAGAEVGCRFTGYGQAIAITNEPGGTLTLSGGSGFEQRNASGWPPVRLEIVNQGTLRSGGEGTNSIENLPLNQGGLIELTEGVLVHSGGGVLPGQAQLAAGTRCDIGGGSYQLEGGQWSGAGTVRVVAGSRLMGRFHADHFVVVADEVSGDFGLSGGFEWMAGRLGGVRVGLGPGNHRIHGDGGKTVQNATISNGGSLVLDACTVGFAFTGYSQYAMLTNEVDGVIEFTGAAVIEQRNSGGWPPAGLGIFNDGLLRFAGPGVKAVTSVPLHNRGRIELLDGTLQHLGGGTSPGVFQIAGGGRIELAGGAYQLNGSRWTGSGQAAVVGNVTLQGEFAADHFRLERGDLTGASRISGGFHWTGGNLIGAQLALGPGEHRISGPDAKGLQMSSLANAGHLVFEAATVGFLFTGYSQSAVLINEQGGELDLLEGARIEQRNGSGWPAVQIGLINRGTLRKQGDGTAVVTAVPVVNRGALDVSGGVLRVESNATFEEGSVVTLGLRSDAALQVLGVAAVAGTLQVSTPPDLEVADGRTFTPLTAGSIVGRFGNEVSLNPGHAFEYVNGYGGGGVTLTARSRLDQAIELLSPTANWIGFSCHVRGQPGLVYYFESSPDLAHWRLEQTVVASAELTPVSQLALGRPFRFFRVRVLP